jgi:hypothetical protein
MDYTTLPEGQGFGRTLGCFVGTNCDLLTRFENRKTKDFVIPGELRCVFQEFFQGRNVPRNTREYKHNPHDHSS